MGNDMIEAMPNPDDLADLKQRVSALEDIVKSLLLANMRLINANVGLIRANNLKTEYSVQNVSQDAQDSYFVIFDSISADFDKLTKS